MDRSFLSFFFHFLPLPSSSFLRRFFIINNKYCNKILIHLIDKFGRCNASLPFPETRRNVLPSLSLSTISYTTRVLIVPNNITSASIRTNKTKKQEKARGIVCARCCLIEYNGHRSSSLYSF